MNEKLKLAGFLRQNRGNEHPKVSQIGRTNDLIEATFSVPTKENLIG